MPFPAETTRSACEIGVSAGIPEDTEDLLVVDMGCVGDGLQCTERQVSICAKDSGGPYSYEVVKKLVAAAKKENADYAVDIYPHYGSDVEATLSAGHDLRHGLIGAGVYASHGYERSHKDGVLNTLVVKKVSRVTFAKFVGPYSRGEYAKFPAYAHCSTPKVIRIHSEKPDIVTCLDGECITGSDVTIRLCDKKLNFFGPDGCSCNATAREAAPAVEQM